jgi:hypothetical protein
MSRYITIATYIGAWEAHLARAKLESEGIFAVVLDDQISSINWFYSNAVGGVRLQVCEADAQKAALILEKTTEHDPATQQESPDLDSSIPACPSCSSTSIRRERFSLPIALLSLLLFGLPFLLNRKRVICMNCNRKWKTSELIMKPQGDPSSL